VKPTVALAESKSHYDGAFKALKLIEDQISEGINGKKKVLIKPNFVTVNWQLAAIHVDAVRAVLDIVSKYYSGRIIVGEGPAFAMLRTALINFDYLKLQKDYDVEFVDLNEDDSVEIEIERSQQGPLRFRVSKTIVESDYRISVALPKTHDFVIATLSIKNIVVGSLVGREKWKIHQGYKAMNVNIAALAEKVMPNVGVIDGFQGMEGRGPGEGDAVDLRVAAASTFPVSLDAVMATVMGFNPQDVGYLYHLDEWGVGVTDLNRIEVIGLPVEKVRRKFRPHPKYHEMLKWR
jgi:uncharacterized protein (DUF362 family)